jgi:uncharacterized protein YyaL (SSP411 family)
MKNKEPNRLIHATSPYLLQHAYNPVEWFEWSKEALEKAQREDKPILVSIGYSSCHWCHVMERESFENRDVADVMNEFFVCIKVDREERPDIDQVYMDAIQAMGKNGGWPLNVFLTPNQKPFFGGTYFSPQVWVQVLTNIHKAYQTRKPDITASADDLAAHLAQQNTGQFRQKTSEADFTLSLNSMYDQLRKKFDRTHGGLDKAPKFIMPSIWHWLLRYQHIAKNKEALDHTLFTLKKIARGGIYDQIGGGFCRYAVDNEWFAPHFEKMLYDNAQLISLYSEAFSVSQDDFFKKIVYETYDWLLREMTHTEGGFYSALDADSEGMEGKYYIWKYDEIVNALGVEQAKIALDLFEVVQDGNWEHGYNILKQKESTEQSPQLQVIKQKLLQERGKRIRPSLDDKILTGWNAMTISGLVDAYHSFSDQRFLDTAIKNARFIQNKLMNEGLLFRSFKERRSSVEGFLEDYAYVIQAWIKLYQATFDEQWLQQAKTLTDYVLTNFFDQEDSSFFFTSSNAEKLIARKKEIFDNVIPSSNGIMAQNLNHLGILLDRDEWKNLAEKMIDDLSHLTISKPNYMSNWGIVLSEIKNGLAEVAFTGPDYLNLKNQFKKEFQPFALVMGAKNTSSLPLLADKLTQSDKSIIYVCYNKTCKLPTSSVVDALQQIV